MMNSSAFNEIVGVRYGSTIYRDMPTIITLLETSDHSYELNRRLSQHGHIVDYTLSIG